MNLYSSVYKWAKSQGENFTTDAFCFLLMEILRIEPELGCKFVNWICFENESFFSESEKPSISTQIWSEDGIPDVVITSPNAFIIIEIKKGSDLHEGQLGQYHRLLKKEKESKGWRRTRLVLLTAFQATYKDSEKPHRELRWSAIELWLQINEFENPIVEYLTAQFCLFLKAEVMAIERVSWEMVEGTRSLLNLVNMVRTAMENIGIGVMQQGVSGNNLGIYSKDYSYWVGVYFDDPDQLVFTQHNAELDAQKLDQIGWDTSTKKPKKSLDLSSEDCHFFARKKDRQLDVLIEFLRSAFDQAETNRQTEQPKVDSET